ncbi:MAG: hypothetical protein Alpg2KO_17280 [Alphaproteobacteria bacterium]
MPVLADTPDLAELQRYVAEMKRERGFSTDDRIAECFLLGEEVGELFKAVRKSEGWRLTDHKRAESVGEELADCLIYLLSIANQHEIDLEAAFRAKEAKNETRVWTHAPDQTEQNETAATANQE